MIITINKCSDVDRFLLADLARYTSVADYVADVMAGKDLFQLWSLTVKVDDNRWMIRSMGSTTLDAKKYLEFIRKLPKSRITIPNDSAIIVNVKCSRNVEIIIP